MADSALSEVGNNRKPRFKIGNTEANIGINSFRFLLINYSVESNIQPFVSDVRRDCGYSFGLSHRLSVSKMTVVAESRCSHLRNGENAKTANISDIRLPKDNVPSNSSI